MLGHRPYQRPPAPAEALPASGSHRDPRLRPCQSTNHGLHQIVATGYRKFLSKNVLNISVSYKVEPSAIVLSEWSVRS